MEKTTVLEKSLKRRGYTNPMGLSVVALSILVLVSFLFVVLMVDSGISSKFATSRHDVAPLAIDSKSGEICIAHPHSDIIQCFTEDGTLLTQWGGHGKNDGQFDFPSSIAVNSEGFIYVLDAYNRRIQIFHQNGKFIEKWSFNDTGDRKLNQPGAISIDSRGIVYLADISTNSIYKFGPHGQFISRLQTDAANPNSHVKARHRECWENRYNTCD